MLRIIAEQLREIGVPYEFMRWTTSITDPYFVGEYTQVITSAEDGFEEYVFLLNGFTHGSYLSLEEMKDVIKERFPIAGGFRTMTQDGKAVVITYENCLQIDTEESDLKRIQIQLDVKTWEGGI